MQRRRFLKGVGAGAVVAGAAACGSERQGGTDSGTQQRFSWKMVTTWPPGLPGLGTGAQDLADAIQRNSGGRIRIQFYAAGELVPPLEVFDAVSTGTAEMGHGAAYYCAVFRHRAVRHECRGNECLAVLRRRVGTVA